MSQSPRDRSAAGADRPGQLDRPRGPGAALLHDLTAIDRAVYEAIAGEDTPSLDGHLRRLSDLANRSTLWMGIAVPLAVVGGRRGRRAASRGMVAIGVASAVVNVGLKSLHHRPRPDRDGAATPIARHVAMPSSSSFPSGHSASAFAFATAAGTELPVLALPLRTLAAAVAYSRIHTGVHYPSDTLAGALIGTVTGFGVVRGMDRRRR